MNADLRASLQRHPELYIQGMALLGVSAILLTNLSVCFPTASAAELMAARQAEEVRERLARPDLPVLAGTDAEARVRADLDRVAVARAGSDGMAYRQEIQRVIVDKEGRQEFVDRGRERPMPVPSATLAAGLDGVEIRWTFAGSFEKAKAYRVTVGRAQLTGPDGAALAAPAERTLATLPCEGAGSYRDAEVEPGCAYRYTVTLTEGARQAAAAPVEAAIALPYKFALSGVANGTAVIQVEKWFGARGWRKETFCVKPGDLLGGQRDTMYGLEVGALDFSTGWKIKDIREERPGAGSSDPKQQFRTVWTVEMSHPKHGVRRLTLER